MKLVNEFIEKAKKVYGGGFIPLHRPVFEGNEKKYLSDCIDSNFVSSVGKKVTEFEKMVSDFTGIKHACAVVNGTSALHISLIASDVKRGDEVITQALTFVATCNAIAYVGASPVFVDVDKDTMGLSPEALKNFLTSHCVKKGGFTYNNNTGKKVAACIPMHTFGIPCRISEIVSICEEWGIQLIEDAAESLGSSVGGAHTGSFGSVSAISFNGNKIITTGGGGMVLSNNDALINKVRHLTTTAKIPHAYEYVHDNIAFNYRMPNLNAALGCAQMEVLPEMLEIKRNIAKGWEEFFSQTEVKVAKPLSGSNTNNWLNAIILPSKKERDLFLEATNEGGVMTRPVWCLMNKLSMFEGFYHDDLSNSKYLEDRVVNIPSSVPEGLLMKSN